MKKTTFSVRLSDEISVIEIIELLEHISDFLPGLNIKDFVIEYDLNTVDYNTEEVLSFKILIRTMKKLAQNHMGYIYSFILGYLIGHLPRNTDVKLTIE